MVGWHAGGGRDLPIGGDIYAGTDISVGDDISWLRVLVGTREDTVEAVDVRVNVTRDNYAEEETGEEGGTAATTSTRRHG